MNSVRLRPPIWRHDAYSLIQLRRLVAAIAEDFHSGALIGALPANVNIVDFGAGDAPYRTLFERPGMSYKTCDLEPGSDYLFEPGQSIPLPNDYGHLVLSFQVLEHVWDLDWYLAEVSRLMSPQSALVLSTHGTWLYHPHPTDFRRWTRDGLIAELTSRGFVVERMTGAVGPLAWTTQFRALGFNRLLRPVPVLGPVIAALVALLMNTRMWIEDALTPAQWKNTNAAIYVVVARKAVTESP